eukprot:gene828-900_t
MLADNKIRSELALQVVDQEHRIEELEEALHEHGIELPEAKLKPQPASVDAVGVSILEDGSIDELRRHLEQRVHLYNLPDTDIEFHNLNFSTTVDVNRSIYTAAQSISKYWTKSMAYENADAVFYYLNITFERSKTTYVLTLSVNACQ